MPRQPSTSNHPTAQPQHLTAPVCRHQPRCPSADSADREAARPVATYPQQGWSLLCNGVLLFEDTGELLPDGEIIAPHRPLGTEHIVTAA